MLKIEKGIPIPDMIPRSYKQECSTAMSRMDIGDSIVVKDRHLCTVKSWIDVLIRRRKNKHKQLIEFTIHSLNEHNHRVWRVK